MVNIINTMEQEKKNKTKTREQLIRKTRTREELVIKAFQMMIKSGEARLVHTEIPTRTGGLLLKDYYKVKPIQKDYEP